LDRSIKILLLVFTIVVIFITPDFGQINDIPKLNISTNADCFSALSISTANIIGPTIPPNGFGKLLEIKDNQANSLYFFENEHHTVWYKFKVTQTANLVFTINPLQESDDYDFLLFKASNENFCSDIINKKVLPVRTNIARSKNSNNGKTGLKFGENNNFIAAGPNYVFSKELKVIKGELYYLVLDNVYDNGDGHYIIFDYVNDQGISLTPKILKGKVIDSVTNMPVLSEITVFDNKGKEFYTTNSNLTTGEFSIIFPANSEFFSNYSLIIKAKGYFFYQSEFIPYKLINEKTILNFRLNKLIQNKTYSITNIYFFPNSPQYIPESEQVIKELLSMMIENPKMKIEIHGHIDGCQGDHYTIQKLSESRAYNIKKYLTDNGINEERVISKGFGCSKMLYKNPENEEQRQMNRRVEILILSI